MKKKLSLILAAVMLVSSCNTAEMQTESEIVTTTTTEAAATDEIECTDFDYTTYINSITIRQYLGNEKNVVIPAEIEGKPVTKFTEDFLKGTDIEEITFSEGITEIPSMKYCDNLKIINLPSTTEHIETFRFCSGLQEINISENEFYKSVEGVLYTADETTLVAFPCGRTGSFNIPKTVKNIGKHAFESSGLSEIILSEQGEVCEIEDYAFYNCTSLTDIVLPANVNKIGFSAFDGSSLKKIILPDGLKKIDSRAFANTDLTELYLPDSLEDCGNNIADDDVLISVSYPFSTFSVINNRKNTVFRNENTLERALRYAGEADKNCKGRIFIDLNMDNFPEMVEIYEYYKQFRYFDFAENEWKSFIDKEYYWGIGGIEPIISTYHLIYSKEQDSYLLCSDVYHYPINYSESETRYIPLQKHITIKDGVFEFHTRDTDFIDINNIEIIKTFDFEKILEDNDTSVTYQQFELVMDRFIYEPDEEIDESRPFEWRDEEITEFPYFNAYYPDYVRLTVMGKDMLAGEKYPKISYNDDVLYLDNAVIHASGNEKFVLYCVGMDMLTIEISGDCYILSDRISSIFNVKNIPVTIQGNGTLYTTKISADTITLDGNVKLVQYDIEEHYDDEQIYDNNRYNKYNYIYDINYLSVKGDSSVECSRIHGYELSLRNNASLSCARLSFEIISTNDNSRIEVGQESFSTGWTEANNLRIRDNSAVKIRGTGNSAIIAKANDHLYINISGNGLLDIEGAEGETAINKSNYYNEGADISLYDNSTINVKGGKFCARINDVNISGGTLNFEADKDGQAVDIIKKGEGFIFSGEVTENKLDNTERKNFSPFWQNEFNTNFGKYQRIYFHVEPIEEE